MDPKYIQYVDTHFSEFFLWTFLRECLEHIAYDHDGIFNNSRFGRERLWGVLTAFEEHESLVFSSLLLSDLEDKVR